MSENWSKAFCCCERWNNQQWQERGTKKKSESPTGIEPMTSRTPGGRSIHWATRTHGERGHFTEFLVDRAPARCSGGHGFDSCRGLRFFLCPTLVSLLIISSFTFNLPSWKFTITFIYHVLLLFVNSRLFALSIFQNDCMHVFIKKAFML